MSRVIGFLLVVLCISACSTMTPARYAVSIDNNLALKRLVGHKTYVASLTPPEEYSSNCRMMGPIQAADGMTIPEFIRKAYNDEFKFAGMYSESDVVLTGSMSRIKFSSVSGLTSGWWDLAITLSSENGRSLAVENRYEFKSGFDAITACNQTANALGAAVQDLINKTVTNPGFPALLKK
jgi:hypothetical protein